MILKLRQRMAQDESGFTLVELLVVMLILGLLAAIAIPAFFNQRDKAKDADAKATVRTAQTAIETYATEQADGGYVGADAPGALSGIEESLNDSPGDTLAVTNLSDTTYTLDVTANDTDRHFLITRNPGGSTTRTCTPDGGGCSGLSW